jgi:hypothetical protein
MFVQSPVMAAPVTYAINGEQYIAVLSGWAVLILSGESN